ncbi:MAG: hypothetical protein ACK5NT_00400 [Pyrinomonadaceae bacterium]
MDERRSALKEARNLLLKLHKILMDQDRTRYEFEFGALSAGRFLELLMSDERFAWLRVLSTLIVRIDEAFDLDDGISEEMIRKFFEETNSLFDETDQFADFKDKSRAGFAESSDAAELRKQIVLIVDKYAW